MSRGSASLWKQQNRRQSLRICVTRQLEAEPPDLCYQAEPSNEYSLSSKSCPGLIISSKSLSPATVVNGPVCIFPANNEFFNRYEFFAQLLENINQNIEADRVASTQIKPAASPRTLILHFSHIVHQSHHTLVGWINIVIHLTDI